jgi:hypothetical protein
LDDGVSPADTIGRAASAACGSTLRAVNAALLPQGLAESPAAVASMRDSHIQSATEIVLLQRARRR